MKNRFYAGLKARTRDYAVIDSLGLFIKRLNDEARNGALVVVEGRRDAEALRSVGFQGELFLLCHNEGFLNLVKEAEGHKKVILLPDLDSKGRWLTKRAALLLQEKKKIIDLFFRRELLSATKGRVRHIEELKRFKEYLQPPIQEATA